MRIPRLVQRKKRKKTSPDTSSTQTKKHKSGIYFPPVDDKSKKAPGDIILPYIPDTYKDIDR